MSAGSFSVFLFRAREIRLRATKTKNFTKTRKHLKSVVERKKSESLTHSTQTHTHKLKTGKIESAKRRRETPLLLKQRERVKRGYVAVIQRARVPEK